MGLGVCVFFIFIFIMLVWFVFIYEMRSNEFVNGTILTATLSLETSIVCGYFLCTFNFFVYYWCNSERR